MERTLPSPPALRALVGLVLLIGGSLSVSADGFAGDRGGLRIASFAVSDNLTQATIGLASTAGVTAVGPAGPLVVSEGSVIVPLQFEGTGVQRVDVELRDAARAVGSLSIEFYPAELYARVGQDFGGTILLMTSLPRTVPQARPADLSGPGSALAVSPSGWHDARASGALPASGDDRAIAELYAIFDDANKPEIGVLCDDRLTGLETFWQMYNGTCFVWCSGYSRIMLDFLRSAAVPARMIGLDGEQGTLSNGVLVQTSEAHQTIERWDGDHWAWIDPTLRVLSVSADGRTLSLRETIDALADVDSRDQLIFTRLDQETGGWWSAPYSEQDEAFTLSLARYLSADKELVVVA